MIICVNIVEQVGGSQPVNFVAADFVITESNYREDMAMLP